MKLRYLPTLALLLIAAACADMRTYSGPEEKLHIYVLVGQSNMSGRAKVEDQDRELPRNLFLLDRTGQWVEATHPFVQYTNVPNAEDQRVSEAAGESGLNLGLAFARKKLEANPDVAIGLIVNSQGGSSIESWKKGGATSNYDKTMDRIRPALNTGVIKGVLWHHGEADHELGEKYLEPLAGVIAQFRQDLGDPTLPFVAGQIAPRTRGQETIEAFNQALLRLPATVPRTAVVRTEDLTGNDLHFNSEETRLLGERYAEQMLKLLAR